MILKIKEIKWFALLFLCQETKLVSCFLLLRWSLHSRQHRLHWYWSTWTDSVLLLHCSAINFSHHQRNVNCWWIHMWIYIQAFSWMEILIFRSQVSNNWMQIIFLKFTYWYISIASSASIFTILFLLFTICNKTLKL